MKILHLTNYFMEGFGYQENWLPYHQMQQGHDVRVVTSDRWFPLPNYKALFLPKYGDRVRGAGRVFEKGVPIFRKRAVEIASRAVTVFPCLKDLRAFSPDVIHVHGATNFNLITVLVYTLFAEATVFVDCHQDHLVTRERSFANRVNYLLWRGFYRVFGGRIAGFLPITRASRDFLTRNLGIPEDRCRISPLGVDLDDKQHSPAARKTFRRQHSLDDCRVIVNAGKQYPGKNILFILEVYRELRRLQPGEPAALVLVGEAVDSYEEQISETIAGILAADAQARIVRLPFLPNAELNAVYSASDLGIWPGVASNTIQEAMACGVVVALLESGITSHLIVDDDLIIADLDVPSVARRLASVLFEPERLATIKEKSDTVVRGFSWRQIAAETLEIYAEGIS